MFVADFIGSSNFLVGTLTTCCVNGSVAVALEDGQHLVLDAPEGGFAHGAVTVAIRPENIRIHAAPSHTEENSNFLRGVIRQASYLGSRFSYLVELGGNFIRVETDQEFADKVITAELPRESCLLFSGG
jgi:ABC-type Fe3+/spermidine/putrescine transport system ATPase subunit